MADHTAEYCGPRIFLAHAKEDTDQVRKVYRQLLSDGYEPWFDDECLLPGDNWQVETLNAIFNCDAFVAFFSHNALAGFRNVQEEFRVALETAEKRRSSREVRLIPATLDNCKVPKVGTFGKHWDSFASVHLGGRDWRSGYARLIKSLGHLPEPMIPENRWEALERTVRDAAQTAGLAAMRYYKSALDKSSALTRDPNPSTRADEYATVSLLQALHGFDRLASDLKCQYVVFAEELDNENVANKIVANLRGNPVVSRLRRSTKEFRKGWRHKLAILVDAIDGTVNFDAGLPFFGSAVAAFLRGQLCAGAVYDPFHHQVFYGSLRPSKDESRRAVANVWTVNTGSVELLSNRRAKVAADRRLVATHLSRTNHKARRRFLKFLPHLYDDRDLACGTYMLNSGQMALAHVSWGNLDAFVNNSTKIWDVAAGEVLITAMGGRVTDFKGKPIDYSASSDTDVVAARTPELHQQLIELVRRHY